MHDLQEEGNYASGGEMVASAVVEALQGVRSLFSPPSLCTHRCFPFQSCDIYLDAPDDSNVTDEHLVSLGRTLVNVVIVRGAQLAIVSHLPTEDHLRLHLDGLKYAIKKLAKFEEDKRREERNKVLSFFKALGHLLIGLDGRAALKIKTSLDALLDESSIEVSASSKTWEPLRAYQRRLITALSKDPCAFTS
jgi:cohesin complex subunit SA-1/2